MKLAGLQKKGVWANRVLRDGGLEVQEDNDREAEITVVIENLHIAHHDKEHNYRPYLHVVGELREVTPTEELPYGVTSLQFAAGQGELVDMFYEFDDEQLGRMVQKGYFHQGFKVPEQIKGAPFEVPAKIDTVCIAPEKITTPDGVPVPVVFVDVKDLGSLNTGLDHSGYDLVDYFEAQASARLPEAVSQHGPQSSAKSYEGEITPLFDESVYDVERDAFVNASTGEVVDAPRPEEGEKLTLAEQMKQINDELEREEEQRAAEQAAEPGSMENVYATRVANGGLDEMYEQLEASTEASAEVAAAGKTEVPAEQEMLPLDFGDQEKEEELGVEKVDLGSAAAKLRHREVRKKISERAAQIKAAEDPDHQHGL